MALSTIAGELGLSKSTVSWHARQLGQAPSAEFARRYDWAAVQRYYDAGHSARQCCEQFGFNKSAWSAAVKREEVIVRPRRPPLCDVLVAGRRTSRHALKQRLVNEGLKAGRCDDCGIEDWLGEPLSLHLHHVNGRSDDNRLENLRLLCPNCHSQTETWGGRNARHAAGGR